MANNYKYSGAHLPVLTASAAIASGALVYQEGFVGVALTSAASGAALNIATEGVWDLVVPSGVARGEVLYADLAAGESVALTLTETATTNTVIGIAITSRDAGTGKAQVKLTGKGHIGIDAE